MSVEENARIVADTIRDVAICSVNEDFGTLQQCKARYGEEAGAVIWTFAVDSLFLGIMKKISS